MKEFPKFSATSAALLACAVWLATPLNCAGQAMSLGAMLQAASEANKQEVKTPPPPKAAPQQPAPSTSAPASKPVAPAASAPVGVPKAPEPVVLAPVIAGPKSAYAEIYEQNVFDPKRQPWIEKVEVPPPPPIPRQTTGTSSRDTRTRRIRRRCRLYPRPDFATR